MKQFVVRILKFLAIALAMLLLCESIYFYSGYYQDKVNGWEVYTAIRKSKQKVCKVKRLLLGDSVAMQMYPCDKDYDDIVSLACNQAVTMAGYYFLLDNFIELNKEALPDEVVLLVNPYTLSSNVDQFAYHYFLKPFYNDKYRALFSSTLQQRISKIKCYQTARLPFIRTSNYSPTYEMPEGDYIFVSPISKEYLERMWNLCKQKGISLQLIFTPAKESNKANIETALEASIINGEFIFDFLIQSKSSLTFLPDSLFKDNVHFEGKSIPNNYLK